MSRMQRDTLFSSSSIWIRNTFVRHSLGRASSNHLDLREFMRFCHYDGSSSASTIRLRAASRSSQYPYATLTGTSMATPHVSGAIALLIEEYEKLLKKELNEMEIFQLLMEHTTPINTMEKVPSRILCNARWIGYL